MINVNKFALSESLILIFFIIKDIFLHLCKKRFKNV